jgi:LPS sulfotransferase NodH
MKYRVSYLIAHTPRTGSNWLCEVLAATGKLGIGHVNRAGLFVGYGPALKKAGVWPDKVFEYFRDSTTPNGVCGMKSDWDYLDTLAEYFPPGALDEILEGYTHHIFLRRADTVAQAVSLWIAAWSGVYTSVNAGKPHKKNPLDVPYKYHEIDKRVKRIKREEMRWLRWYAAQDISPHIVYYEEMAKPGGMEQVVRGIFDYLGVQAPDTINTQLNLHLQTNPLKASYVARFLAERIERERAVW